LRESICDLDKFERELIKREKFSYALSRIN